MISELILYFDLKLVLSDCYKLGRLGGTNISNNNLERSENLVWPEMTPTWRHQFIHKHFNEYELSKFIIIIKWKKCSGEVLKYQNCAWACILKSKILEHSLNPVKLWCPFMVISTLPLKFNVDGKFFSP